MKLTHLRISRLGPFYFNHEIEIDPRVTILTGSNDTGKSCSLRFVRLLLENRGNGCQPGLLAGISGQVDGRPIAKGRIAIPY